MNLINQIEFFWGPNCSQQSQINLIESDSKNLIIIKTAQIDSIESNHKKRRIWGNLMYPLSYLD